MISDATAASLMLASSKSFCTRLIRVTRSRIKVLRYARQVPQFPLGHRGDEAGAQQAMLQELGQPGGILDVRLAPGHGFDVLGIDQQHLARALRAC